MLAFVLLTPIGCTSSPDHGDGPSSDETSNDGASTDETTESGDPANACETANACVFDCGSDETCALECAANLGGEAGAALEELINCAITAGCTGGTGGDQACLEASCGNEVGAYDDLCPGGEEDSDGEEDSNGVDGLDCEAALDGCVFECGSDEACALECAASLGGEKGAALEELVNCMSSAGCGFNDTCLDTACGEEFTAFDELCV